MTFEAFSHFKPLFSANLTNRGLPVWPFYRLASNDRDYGLQTIFFRLGFRH